MSNLPTSTSALLAEHASGLMPAQSRLFANFTLRTTAGATERQWTPGEAEARRYEALRIASAAVTAEEAGESELAKSAYRRAAELFEWLIPEDLDDESRLLSAALYQLAELPAMARSVIGSDSAMHDVYSAFLAGDFPLFEQLADQYAGIFGNDPARVNAGPAREAVGRLLIAALNIVVAELRWGDPRFEEVDSSLRQVAGFFHLSRATTGLLFATAFRKIAATYGASSLRSVTRPISSQLSEEGARALERYIRGAYQSGRPVAWPTQRRGLGRLATPGNFALCTPTGSGKTTIAEVAILQSLYSAGTGWGDVGFGRLALYIVPSRALASEVERRLASSFNDPEAFPINIVSSYGGNDISASEDWLSSQAPTVIVCTQEKTDGLLRAAGALFVNRLKLVIVDEAHSIALRDESYERPLRLETLISRLRLLRGDAMRLIGLSAVVDRDDGSLGRWFNPDQPETIRVPYQSTRRLFGRLMISSTGEFLAEYDLVNGALAGGSANMGNRPRIPRIVPHFGHLPKVSRGKKRGSWVGGDIQLRAAALWAAVHLSRVDSPTSGAVLITVGSKIEDYAAAFLGYLENWNDLPAYYHGPENDSDQSILEAAKLACSDYFGESSFEYRLLGRGIVVHHGKLPMSLSRHFVRLIDAGIIRICLATSTLSEGLNLPFETILLPTIRGHSGTGRYSAEEVRNVIGRAGRPGLAREGRALVLMGAGGAFVYNAKLYQELLNDLSGEVAPPEPRSALAHVLNLIHSEWRRLGGAMPFDEWLEVATSDAMFSAERPLPAEALEDLDAFLIAVDVEYQNITGSELMESALEDRLRLLWQRTYLFALNDNERGFQALVARARAVRKRGDLDERLRIYRTSMRPRSAEKLIALTPPLRELLGEALEYSRWQDVQRLTFLMRIVEMLMVVPQFNFTSELKRGDPTLSDVLTWWVGTFDGRIDEKKIGRWYTLANSVFAFRFTWALSSAILTVLDPEPLDGGRLEDRLVRAGLPRVLQWFRDMMVVGVLDPVAAVLMQRGFTPTREAAYAAAKEYYDTLPAATDECYAFASIDSWANNKYATRKEPTSGRLRDFSVAVSTVAVVGSSYRVRPYAANGRTVWRDISGYPIATSSSVMNESEPWTDYILDVDKSVVVASPYLTLSI